MVGGDFITLRSGKGTVYGVSGLTESLLRHLLANPGRLLWESLDRPVKLDYDSLVVQARLPSAGRSTDVAYKRYRQRNHWKAFCAAFRRSRARRAWRLARALLAHGIPTARPLAMVEVRRLSLPTESYLATEWIENAENLHLFGWRMAPCLDRQRQRSVARCAASLGKLVGRMHASHIAHRDLKGANLLVAEQAEGTSRSGIAAYLVDVDGMRLCRRLSATRRAADLARLAASVEAHPWVSRATRCRFLHAYARQFPPGTIAWKSLWRQVARRSRRIVQRKRRRGQDVL